MNPQKFISRQNFIIAGLANAAPISASTISKQVVYVKALLNERLPNVCPQAGVSPQWKAQFFHQARATPLNSHSSLRNDALPVSHGWNNLPVMKRGWHGGPWNTKGRDVPFSSHGKPCAKSRSEGSRSALNQPSSWSPGPWAARWRKLPLSWVLTSAALIPETGISPGAALWVGRVPWLHKKTTVSYWTWKAAPLWGFSIEEGTRGSNPHPHSSPAFLPGAPGPPLATGFRSAVLPVFPWPRPGGEGGKADWPTKVIKERFPLEMGSANAFCKGPGSNC